MQFEKEHPDIQIKYVIQNDTHYKRSIQNWLTQIKGLDVLYWQAGLRLNQIAAQGLLEPLDELWQAQRWQEHFPKGIQAIIRQDEHFYGLPYSYYQWGFYYKKSLFSQLGITVPQTWMEFISVCEKLKASGVTPIVVGGKGKWPAASWFDYLNLRINGLAFHQQLMKGHIPYTDTRVSNVLYKWKQLIDLRYFIPTMNDKNWTEVLPYIYRDIAGMTLLGNFAEQHIADKSSDDIAFFRFPEINPNIPLYEETPIEIFVMPKNAQHKAAAKVFLTFVGRADIQESLNNELGYIAPHNQAKKNSFYESYLNIEMKANDNGLAQYFDRDTAELMSIEGVKILSAFLSNADVELTALNLEKIRLQAFADDLVQH
nr:ABC transporter substrate-binding protein [Paraglaciecola sp. 20A4]